MEKTVVYIDMVADLFHYGHIRFIKNCRKHGDLLYVGVHNDEDVKSYKRIPFIHMNERIEVLESCKYIDKVISNAPLNIDADFILKNKINIICKPDNINNTIKKIHDTDVKIVSYTKSVSSSEILSGLKYI
jgi:cytidyltransferase-like protein